MYYIWNYHVTYTDFSSILYLDAFSVHLTIESHVTMLSTKILVQSYTWIHFQFTFLLNLMLLLLSTQILVQSYTWTHFQFTFLLNQMLLLLSTQILVQSYTWIHFHSIFLCNLMFTMLSTQISYKYYIYVHIILLETPINRILHLKLPCYVHRF